VTVVWLQHHKTSEGTERAETILTSVFFHWPCK